MALPALIAPIAKTIGSAGIFTAASRGFSRLIPKAKSAFQSLSQNARSALGLGAGGTVGFGIGEIFDTLGIKSKELQTISIIGVIIAAVVALGQLFNFDIEV